MNSPGAVAEWRDSPGEMESEAVSAVVMGMTEVDADNRYPLSSLLIDADFFNSFPDDFDERRRPRLNQKTIARPGLLYYSPSSSVIYCSLLCSVEPCLSAQQSAYATWVQLQGATVASTDQQ
ncbi:hypothetical protein ABZP36_025344 [Zizania latifolia]